MRTLILLLVIASPLRAAAQPVPKAQLAAIADDLLAAWEGADLVCLGENHGSLADAALRTALVEHPDFVATVDVIVFEGANPVHQDLLDHFILDGEELSRSKLQPIWRDAGRGVVWNLPIYEEFLRTVRLVNLKFPRPQRVRVLGGALPISWAEIVTADDLLPWRDREAYLGRWIRREILDKNLKTLAVFGSYHCEKRGQSFVAALQADYPGRTWSAFAFVGEEGVREGRDRLGLGESAALVPVAGARGNTLVGAAFFEGHAYAGVRFHELLDAAVYYGAIKDVVQHVDEDALDPEFHREVARRDRLRRQAAQD